MMFHILILDDDELYGRDLRHHLHNRADLRCDPIAVTTAEAARTAVLEAQTPFDVFLIDQRLGPQQDGIDVLRDLWRLSPHTEAIIFTMIGDTAARQRVFKAGVYRYLHKPFEVEDLVLTLHSLLEWRSTRLERDALKVLAEIAEAAQHAVTVEDLGVVVVHGARRLGFERADLWLLEQSADELIVVGISQVGSSWKQPMSDIRFPAAKSPYVKQTLASREPVIFKDLEHGPLSLSSHISPEILPPPSGDWASLPLWAGDRCLGLLTLNNLSLPRHIFEEERQELALLGQQVAAALDRVQIYAQEQAKSRELERRNAEFSLLAQIGQRITNRAAKVDLDTLLCELRTLIGVLMDVRNFFVALYDEQTDYIDVRLDVQNERFRSRRRLPKQTGLVGYVIQHGQSLLLTGGTGRFHREHKIRRYGEAAHCWLGVPLSVEGRVIGAIVVQSYDEDEAYAQADEWLLTEVAAQVAGAIQATRLKEAADRNARRLAVIQRASEELMRLAEQSDELLWHTMLTATTAGYGLGFNRAMLFLTEGGGTMLRGRMGIGELERRKAHRSWERDKRRQRTFDTYLEELKARAFPRTIVDLLVRDQVMYLPDDHGAFSEALDTKQRVIVREQDAASRMPRQFVEYFGTTTYAVLPLLVGDKRLGVLVLDNIHNDKPLRDPPLKQLEAFLALVGLVYENLRQRRASDQLIEANHIVLAQVANLPLRETLTQICRAVQGITGADSVVIYPFVTDTTLSDPCYDIENTGYIGLQNEFQPRERPGPNGVTMRLLYSGEAIVLNDVERTDWFDAQHIERHSFLKRESLRAFIAVPIQNRTTGGSLGALYINYRAPQTFGAQDVRRGQSFAELAGAAIRAARQGEADRLGRQAAEQSSQRRAHELEQLRRVLETALQPDVDRDQVAHSLLVAASELLGRPGTQIGLVLREWEMPRNPQQEPREVGKQYFVRPDGTLASRCDEKLYSGIGGRAFVTSEDQYAPDVQEEQWQQIYRPRFFTTSTTRSELDILIKLEGRQILGLFNLESPKPNDFPEEQHQTLRRIAAVAALALDHVRRQDNLLNVLNASESVVAPADLDTTLEAVLEAARRVAPEVAAITIWYTDSNGRMTLGPYFGVRHPERMKAVPPDGHSTASMVMRSREPILVQDVERDARLGIRFVTEEKIRSSAAFPLHADNEDVGAIFFSYRSPHEFTSEEKVIFPILAAVAAASVRDALRLEVVRKERQRLQVAKEITESVGTMLKLDETLRAVLEVLRQYFPHAQPSVLTHNIQKEELEFSPVSYDFYRIDDREQVRDLKIHGARSIACRVAHEALRLKKQICENIPDVRTDPNYLEANPETLSQLCYALMGSDQQLLGVLVLESAELRAFSDDDVALLQTVAQSISIAIERAYQSAELRFKRSITAATTWVAEFAHDINKEVYKIRNHAYMLRSQLDGRLQNYVDRIDESAGQLAAYARAPRAQEQVKLALDDWLNQNGEQFARNRGLGVEYRFEPDCAGICVYASPVLLERVLRHLIRNAIEAIDGCGRVTMRTLRRDDWVEVQVANAGPDIPQDIRQQLFVEQISTKGTKREGFEGVEGDGVEGGLGLLFVRWAVEAMDGTINVLPKAGDEVIFAFTLRMVPNDQV